LIPQPSSIDHLVISETGFKKLVTFLGAFPAILDIVRAFGESPGEDQRSGGSFKDHSDTQKGIYGMVGSLPMAKRFHEYWLMRAESTFLLKHVERHEREEQSDPWSIRQMGIYFQANKSLGQSTFILINASKRVQQRMKAGSETAFGAAEMHLLLLSTIMHGWREYLDYLEHRLDVVVRQLSLSKKMLANAY
jgi:hypothetical protein